MKWEASCKSDYHIEKNKKKNKQTLNRHDILVWLPGMTDLQTDQSARRCRVFWIPQNALFLFRISSVTDVSCL